MIWLWVISCLLLRASAISNTSFPDGFKFGVATAAYQVEGGWNEDGKGESMWDNYVHTNPENILNNSTGDVACDSYHKYEEDIQILKTLGVDFYRFSISWSRILPNGTTNNVNQKGVNYYLNVLKLLKENNIEAMVTLYHWDLPEYLNELGGWTNPLIVNYFGEYARLCYQLFGDYVKYWVTLNEPQSSCGGYNVQKGFSLAPGYSLPAEGVYLCAYTHIKSHALAYHIYDQEFRATQKGRVSLSLVTNWYEPASQSYDDLVAQDLALQFNMGLFAHPIYVGNWPEVVIHRVQNRSKLEGLPKSRLPELTSDEIEFIKGTYDWFGLNHYSTNLVQFAWREDDLPGNASFNVDGGTQLSVNSTWTHSNASTWLYVVPWGLRKMLNFVYKNYNQPEIIITENGWSDDGSSLDDPERVTYLQEYLSSLLDARYEDGVNVTGYTQWSIMDNFEWTWGYTSKFGLVSVDFDSDNRTRTPKTSYSWFKNVLKTRCLVDDCGGVPSGEPSIVTPISAVFVVILSIYTCIINVF